MKRKDYIHNFMQADVEEGGPDSCSENEKDVAKEQKIKILCG